MTTGNYILNLRSLQLLAVTCLTASCLNHGSVPAETDSGNHYLQAQFVDILDIKGVPRDPKEMKPFSFSDLGAWHSYSLPAEDDRQSYGSVVGPFLMSQGNGIWQGKNLFKARLIDRQKGEELDLADSKPVINYQPGKLIQKYDLDDLSISIDLIFVSSRSALIDLSVSNKTNVATPIEVGFNGATWLKDAAVSDLPGMLNVSFTGSPEQSILHFSEDTKIQTSDHSYEVNWGVHTIPGNETIHFPVIHSVTFDAGELQNEREIAIKAINDPDAQFSTNQGRWENYLQQVLDNSSDEWKDWRHREIVAVKALQTLITNWRSPAGELKNDGLFPSYAYRGFHGFWSWDSWKHSVALSTFHPELAKNQIRAMFDYQDEHGMIADCIYRDTLIENHNWRDTKPPLAAWSVKKTYDATGDVSFVREMYPKLVSYHEWWYKFRDIDNNGLCEFGSTDGTKTAAMWESGMDNAVRFDEAAMLGSSDRGWSLNQESVDLNAYLYREKQTLAELAAVLALPKDADRFTNEAEILLDSIRQVFYDMTTAYFYDRRLDGDLIKVMGPEAWTVLWAAAATESQAHDVRNRIMDNAVFNTLVPFPTLNSASEKFEPARGYWRGPVWMDQAYFAIEGLKGYGYNEDADRLGKKLLENMDGLVDPGKPIYENYNPENGKGLNAPNFSWSAAHILMLINS